MARADRQARPADLARVDHVPPHLGRRLDHDEEIGGRLGQLAERHRHRFEFKNAYREVLQEAGMVLSGISPDGRLVEIAEMADHPFMLATQFHPEFLSRPNRPHPLFVSFLDAAKTQAKKS